MVGFIPGLAAMLPRSNQLVFDGDSAHAGIVRCAPQADDLAGPHIAN